MKGRTLIMLALALLLVACDAPDEELTAAPDAALSQMTPDAGPDEQPDVAPTDTVAPDPPTDSLASEILATTTQEGQVEERATATLESQPTSPPAPTETAAPVFNGEYEDTFFRGLETAPITMIDYSDFL